MAIPLSYSTWKQNNLTFLISAVPGKTIGYPSPIFFCQTGYKSSVSGICFCHGGSKVALQVFPLPGINYKLPPWYSLVPERNSKMLLRYFVLPWKITVDMPVLPLSRKNHMLSSGLSFYLKWKTSHHSGISFCPGENRDCFYKIPKLSIRKCNFSLVISSSIVSICTAPDFNSYRTISIRSSKFV